MKTNIGSTDRAIRIILGLIVMAAGYYYGSWLGLIGLVLLATGLCRMCCLYSVFGINTDKTAKNSARSD